MSIYSWVIITCWATFFLFWIISAFGVKRDASRSLWQRLGWLRISIVIVFIDWLLKSSPLGTFTSRNIIYLGTLQSGLSYKPLAALGALLCVAGIALAILARIHLGRNWSPAPALKEEHELVTSGPYTLIRHPIYTGILAALLGTAIATPWGFVPFLIFCSLFIWRVKVEEDLMMKQFPNQYLEYKEKTKALIPFVW